MNSLDAITSIRSFNRFYTNIIGLVDRFLLNSPYSLTEARLLWEISQNEQLNARKLKNILQIDEGYLSRTIKKLTDEKLIKKEKSEYDSRIFSLSLTDKGKLLINELNEKSSKEIFELIENIKENELSDLVSCMDQIKLLLGKETALNEDKS